jgi:hypothetical protein
MARLKFLTVFWISGLVCGWLATHGLTLPLCWGADRESRTVFSLAVNNERLDGVLDKISKATGYEITVNEGWRSRTVSARLDNVTLEEGLKVILEELGRPSHLLIYDKGKKRVEIVLLAAPSSRSEAAAKVEPSAPLRFRRQTAPPASERAKPVTRPSLRRIRERPPRAPLPPEKTSDRVGPEESGQDPFSVKKGPPDTETEVDEPPGEGPDSTQPEEMTPQTKPEAKAIPEPRRRPVETPEE